MPELFAATRLGRRIAVAALIGISAVTMPIHAPAAAAGTAQSPDRLSYVLLGPGGRDNMMSGSMDDLRRAKSLQAGGERLLYVRLDGADYAIRDPETLRRAEAIFAPQQALGAQQAELGKRQAALGKRQAQLGLRQAGLASKQAGAELSRAGEFGRQQGELGRQQKALGEQQNALGKQQATLGREQARLGREFEAKIRALVADAVRQGVATRVS